MQPELIPKNRMPGEMIPPRTALIAKSTPLPAQRIILHLDMDSFYASVEMAEHPEYRSKPVVIGADPKQGTGRGVVCTCSYEARAFGIQSAMPVSQAYSLCPDAVFLPPRFPVYIRVSEKVMAILKSCGFDFEQVSIDEAFLDITPVGDFIAARNLAARLKEEIKKTLGLTCSIGIAPAKTVAKIASDFHKPDGITVVEPDAVIRFLAPLAVRKIPGIGKKTEAVLHDMGIMTIADLGACDIQVLIARFGHAGIAMHEIAAGIDSGEVAEREGVRSLSRMITFPEDTADPQRLAVTMADLSREVHQSLTDEHLRFKTITVTVRYQGFVTKTKAKTLSHYTDSDTAIHVSSMALLKDLFDGRKIRLLGLRLSGLIRQDARQMTLF